MQRREDPSSCHACPCGRDRQQTPISRPGSSDLRRRPSLGPMARAGATHSRDSTGVGVGPCPLPAAKDTEEQGSLLPSGCSESGGGFHSVKVAIWGQRHEPQGGLCAGCPALARGSAVTESAVCAHQTVSRWSRAPSHSSRRPHGSCPGRLLSEPSVCFVLICTSNPRS